MEPTPYAQKIRPTLRQAIALLEKARGVREVFAPEITDCTFRMSITDISEIVLLPTLRNHLRQVALKIRIEAENISTVSPRRLEAEKQTSRLASCPNLKPGSTSRHCLPRIRFASLRKPSACQR